MTPPLDPFDPDLLALPSDGVTAKKVDLKPRKRSRQFLPALPEPVFCRLVQLPRRACAVYMVLSLRCRLSRSMTVDLTSTFLARFGLTRSNKRHALSDLERAGLVRVERRNRRNPTVTLLPTEEP